MADGIIGQLVELDPAGQALGDDHIWINGPDFAQQPAGYLQGLLEKSRLKPITPALPQQ